MLGNSAHVVPGSYKQAFDSVKKANVNLELVEERRA